MKNNQLSSNHLQPILMKLSLGKTPQEIADEMNVNILWVKSWILWHQSDLKAVEEGREAREYRAMALVQKMQNPFA